jgi:hypothetical protein
MHCLPVDGSSGYEGEIRTAPPCGP